ncbi:MAG: hypothetical protein HQM08_20745 [Candidatus Riflebacteria bacterium]|nr:hypothetical protein [Candidatus Riflebacteria bacterium]
MERITYSTLMEAAEEISHSELSIAPELPTLFALDANLLAAINILDFQNPSVSDPWQRNPEIADGVEENIANAIVIMARALRHNLTAYYAAIQEKRKSCSNPNEIEF